MNIAIPLSCMSLFTGIIFYMSISVWNMTRMVLYYSCNRLQTSWHFQTTSHANSYHHSYWSLSVCTLFSLLAQEMASTNPRLYEQKFGWEDGLHCILYFQINSTQNSHTFMNSHPITHHHCLSQQGYKQGYKDDVQFFPYVPKYRQNYPFELSIYFFFV
jgi:hypothetical protein